MKLFLFSWQHRTIYTEIPKDGQSRRKLETKQCTIDTTDQLKCWFSSYITNRIKAVIPNLSSIKNPSRSYLGTFIIHFFLSTASRTIIINLLFYQGHQQILLTLKFFIVECEKIKPLIH